MSLTSQATAGAYSHHGLPRDSVVAAGSSKAQAIDSYHPTAGPMSTGSFGKLEGLKYYTKLDEDNGDRSRAFEDMSLGQLRSLVTNEEEGEDYPKAIQSASVIYYFVFLKTGAIEDLERAIDRARKDTPTKQDDPDHAPRLKDLIVMLINKYERTNSLSDLQEAIFRAIEMVTATPEDHPDRSVRMGDLIMMLMKSGRTGSEDDLNEAIIIAREMRQVQLPILRLRWSYFILRQR